jgi:hypothetical protein
MDEKALERARQHIETARSGRGSKKLEAALERARAELETLTAVAADLETGLPQRVSDAVHEGLSREVAVVGRNLAEIRGLLNNVVHRLERLEQEVLAERHARIDDLALLVELVSAGWRSVDARIAQQQEITGPPSRVLPLAADAAA